MPYHYRPHSNGRGFEILTEEEYRTEQNRKGVIIVILFAIAGIYYEAHELYCKYFDSQPDVGASQTTQQKGKQTPQLSGSPVEKNIARTELSVQRSEALNAAEQNIRNFFIALNVGDTGALRSAFSTNSVSYFDKGKKDITDIITDSISYFRKFPERNFQILTLDQNIDTDGTCTTVVNAECSQSSESGQIQHFNVKYRFVCREEHGEMRIISISNH